MGLFRFAPFTALIASRPRYCRLAFACSRTTPSWVQIPLLLITQKRPPFGGLFALLERAMGFGPTTSTLARLRSTPELYPHRFDDILNITSKIKCKHFFSFFAYFFIRKGSKSLPFFVFLIRPYEALLLRLLAFQQSPLSSSPLAFLSRGGEP